MVTLPAAAHKGKRVTPVGITNAVQALRNIAECFVPEWFW